MDMVKRNKVAGFTLIEVLMAILLLTIGIISVWSMQLSSIKGNHTAMIITSETNMASSFLEEIIAAPYVGGVSGIDDDCDGTVDEAGEDILDNNGSDSLNDAPPSTDVGNSACPVTSPDGRYNVYWNVRTNFPAANMKTIRVIVRNSRGPTKQVSFTIVKTQLY